MIITQALIVLSYNSANNDEAMRDHLDLAEETREMARIWLAVYQQRMSRYHNARVKPRSFEAGDLVLRNAHASKPAKASGKLSPNMEGPYWVKEVI